MASKDILEWWLENAIVNECLGTCNLTLDPLLEVKPCAFGNVPPTTQFPRL